MFGWQNSGEDQTWGSTVDTSALDGSNGFVMTGSTSNGHFGCVRRTYIFYDISLVRMSIVFPALQAELIYDTFSTPITRRQNFESSRQVAGGCSKIVQMPLGAHSCSRAFVSVVNLCALVNGGQHFFFFYECRIR